LRSTALEVNELAFLPCPLNFSSTSQPQIIRYYKILAKDLSKTAARRL
jgi:hypothetical protein